MTATPPEDDDRPAPGARLLAGRYRLVREVGAGGMGVVWEAVHAATGRRVAVKLLRPTHGERGRATLTTEASGRFLREARATARVRHPNVVEVIDAGRDAALGELFIVYDFLAGETLRALLERRGRLAPDEAARLLLPVMDGLAEVHRASILHRDLKPENVILAQEPGGRVAPRLIDFGVARADDADDLSLTRTGAALGTAHYMSPEQARGARDLDARSDVWAMGVLWFEALTGALPYEGSGYNEVLAKILAGPPPSLASALPGAPRALADAVDRALAHDRGARHATVDAFIAALRAALSHEGALPAPLPSSTPSRRRAWIVAGLAALALGAASVGASVRRAPSPPRTAPPPLAAATTTRTLPSPPRAPPPTPPPARAASVEAPPSRLPIPPSHPSPRRVEAPRRAPATRPVAPAVHGAVAHRPTQVNGAIVLEP